MRFCEALEQHNIVAYVARHFLKLGDETLQKQIIVVKLISYRKSILISNIGEIDFKLTLHLFAYSIGTIYDGRKE